MTPPEHEGDGAITAVMLVVIALAIVGVIASSAMCADRFDRCIEKGWGSDNDGIFICAPAKAVPA